MQGFAAGGTGFDGVPVFDKHLDDVTRFDVPPPEHSNNSQREQVFLVVIVSGISTIPEEISGNLTEGIPADSDPAGKRELV